MHCPYCDYQDSSVIDSRAVSAGVRRRRQCGHCGRRFTTYERIQAESFLVIKKDGRREEYRRDKLADGISKACAKRPIPYESIEALVDDIEQQLHQIGKVEVPSSSIGELVMERLAEVDRIAYVRFASVYRDFADIQALKKEVDALVETEARKSPSAQLALIPQEEAGDAGKKSAGKARAPSRRKKLSGSARGE